MGKQIRRGAVVAAALAALGLGTVLWRREGGFYALFIPLAGVGIVAAAVWFALSDGPGEALRQAVTGLMNLTPGYLL